MTHEDGSECCQSDENDVVRMTAAQVERDAARARRLGLALVALGTISMLAAAIFSGYAAFRAEEQSDFNEQLMEVFARYNVEHARNSSDSHAALANNLRCVVLVFSTPIEEDTAANLEACFLPTSPAPPSPPELNREGGNP